MSISRLVRALARSVLLAGFVLLLIALFSSRSSLTNQPSSLASSQLATATIGEELDRTVGWTVYSNDEYRLTIKHPTRLKVEELSPSVIKFYSPEAAPDAIMPDEEETQDQFTKQYVLILLQIHENPSRLPLNEALRQIYSRPGIDKRTTEFDTMEIHLQSYPNGPLGALTFEGSIGENPQKSVFFSYRDNIYQLTLYGSGGTGGEYSTTAEMIFDQMITTIELQQ